MYEAVHAAPDGEATVARLALTAREYGFDGVVVRNHGDSRADVDAGAVARETGVDVVSGMEIRADDPESASGYLGNYRPDYTILAVHGGTVAMNGFAVSQPKVDVLAHPMRGDGDLNHVLARQAAENGVRLELDLGRVLRERGGTRVRAIQGLRKLWELIEDADAPFVVTADPYSHLQVRARRELVAVGRAIGLDEGAIETGLAEWAHLAERNRDRLSESFVEPGVRVRRPTAADESDGGPAGPATSRRDDHDSGDGDGDRGDDGGDRTDHDGGDGADDRGNVRDDRTADNDGEAPDGGGTRS